MPAGYQSSGTVRIVYDDFGIISKVFFEDRNGKDWDLTEMMFISAVGFSYKADNGHPQVTLTFDARLTEGS